MSQTVLRPRDLTELADCVGDAAARGRTLEVVGGGSKAGVGRPVRAEARLEVGAIAGVVDYDPAELVLTARAGTPLAEIEALVAAHGQRLAFEPFDAAPMFGESPGRATLGGVVAANVCGPRRVLAGAARDHLLGFQAVSGRGEAFKAGGRVVKNVTGYDLCKLMAGSWGTLAVLAEVTLKVLPRPEAEATLVLQALSDAEAARAMAAAMGSPAEVNGAAHLPAQVSGTGVALTLLRLDGREAPLRARLDALAGRLAGYGPSAPVFGEDSDRLWRDVRAAAPLQDPDRPLWRVSAPPAQAWRAAAELADLEGRHLYDWAGGLLWLEVPPDAEAFAPRVRAAAAAIDASARLTRAPEDVRLRAPPFPPEPAAVARLSERVRAAFDPARVLNPGRMRPPEA